MQNKSSGKFHVELRNFKETPWRDLYHKWLTLSWLQSFALFGLTFFLLNLIFGSLFWLLGPDAILNSSGSFWDCFFFSVQTIGTIGYGHLAPQSIAANVLVVIEAASGMVTIALLSGLFFGKFSQPRARIRFTKKMLISIHHGQKSLQFRMANNRMNPIIDAKMNLTLLRPQVSSEGMRMRKSYDLPLELSHAPMFAMSLTGMHNLETGPLKDIDLSQMCDEGYEFIVSIIGTDATFGQTIYSTQVYFAEDIVAQGRWGNIGEVLPDGTRVVDLKDFDTIITQ
jgi:inward rectifier potassium channel